MFAIVTSFGETKEQVLVKLRKAIAELETESANNAIGDGYEFEIYPGEFVYMADLIHPNFWKSHGTV